MFYESSFACTGKGKGNATEERNDAIFTIVRSFKIEQSFYEDNRAWRKRRNSGRKSEILCFFMTLLHNEFVKEKFTIFRISLCYIANSCSMLFQTSNFHFRFCGLKIITFRIFTVNTWFLIKYTFIKK